MRSLSRKKKIVIFVVVALVALIGAGAAYAISIFGNFHPVEFTKDNSELGITSENDPLGDNGSSEITNIALFGVDSRKKDKTNGRFIGNADCVMIMSVDKLHNKIKLTSIMRDSLVQVENYHDMKLTDVYGKGGPELAIKTINQNFGTNIRDYATINFANMAEIVDAVGGVDIDVAEEEIPNANASIGEQFKELGITGTGISQPGMQTLNGIQAVGYARIRKVANDNGSYGDFGRTDRQREVMEQLFHKALKMDFWKYPDFIRQMIPLVETSLDYDDVFGLAGIMTRQVTFSQTRVPLIEYTIDDGYYIGDVSYVYYNLDYAASVIRAYIYDDIEPETYILENKWPSTGHRVTPSDKNTSSRSSTNNSSGSKSSTNNSNDNDKTSKTVNSPTPSTSAPSTSSDDGGEEKPPTPSETPSSPASSSGNNSTSTPSVSEPGSTD